MQDYHIHSTYSPDSTLTIDEACHKAQKTGLTDMAFTEHVEFDIPQLDSDNPHNDGWLQKDIFLDTGAYKKALAKVRPLYPDLKILRGVEIGFQPHLIKKISDYLAENDFEFIIASIHIIEDFKKSFTISDHANSFENYLQTTKLMAENISFQVNGHFDGTVRRFLSGFDETIDYSDFQNQIDEILQILISKGKGLEINTSHASFDLPSPFPKIEIIKRYRKLGGEIITLGSDAHSLDSMGQNLHLGYELLQQAGFKHYTCFKDQKPIQQKINF